MYPSVALCYNPHHTPPFPISSVCCLCLSLIFWVGLEAVGGQDLNLLPPYSLPRPSPVPSMKQVNRQLLNSCLTKSGGLGDTDKYDVDLALKTFTIGLERSRLQNLFENNLPTTPGWDCDTAIEEMACN